VAGGMTINLAGANGDETIARIAAQAARQAYAARSRQPSPRSVKPSARHDY